MDIGDFHLLVSLPGQVCISPAVLLDWEINTIVEIDSVAPLPDRPYLLRGARDQAACHEKSGVKFDVFVGFFAECPHGETVSLRLDTANFLSHELLKAWLRKRLFIMVVENPARRFTLVPRFITLLRKSTSDMAALRLLSLQGLTIAQIR
jgi:hypothetical protein